MRFGNDSFALLNDTFPNLNDTFLSLNDTFTNLRANMIFSKLLIYGRLSAFGHLFQKRTLCEKHLSVDNQGITLMAQILPTEKAEQRTTYKQNKQIKI